MDSKSRIFPTNDRGPDCTKDGHSDGYKIESGSRNAGPMFFMVSVSSPIRCIGIQMGHEQSTVKWLNW